MGIINGRATPLNPLCLLCLCTFAEGLPDSVVYVTGNLLPKQEERNPTK